MQILKEEEELNRAFGTGPKLPVPPKAAAAQGGEGGEEGGPKMSKILIYGSDSQCEVAQRMIEEAMDNKVESLAGVPAGRAWALPAHPPPCGQPSATCLAWASPVDLLACTGISPAAGCLGY